jgi:hypothetical protein
LPRTLKKCNFAMSRRMGNVPQSAWLQKRNTSLRRAGLPIALACAFLLFPASAINAAGQPSASTPGPLPGGLVVVIANPQQADEPLDLRALTNASVSSVAFQIRWRDIEPVEGKPDWSRLDQLFAAAETSGKWVQLLVFPGFFSPTWAMEGAQTEFFPLQYGPGKGTAALLPMPWDQVYLARWFTFLKQLSGRYGNSAAFRVIAADGPTSVSAEFTLPGTPADLRTWLSAGYTPERYIQAWQQVFRFFSASFPRQYVSLSLGIGLGINNRGQRDPSERMEMQQTIIAQGMEIVGSRFALQFSNLDGSAGPAPDPPGIALVNSYSGRMVTGLQLRTSCERNSGNMGADGDPPLALKRALAKAAALNAAGRHVNYVEIYSPDVAADEMQPALRDGAALFK